MRRSSGRQAPSDPALNRLRSLARTTGPLAALGFLAAIALPAAAHAAADASSPTKPIPYVALAAPAAPGDVEGEIASAARSNGLDPALVRAVAVQESGLRREARSHRGAMGVMQLTADTAKDLGVDPKDLHQNIQGGAAYLRTLLVAFGGDVAKALAAYNAGPGAVQRYGGVPPFGETRHYVTSILARVTEGAATAVTTPLPAQAARAAVQVAASGVKAAAQAAPQIAAAATGAVREGSDPIGDAIATALGR